MTRNASAVRRLKNCINIYRKEISLCLLTIIRIIQKQGQNGNFGAWDQFVFFLFHFVFSAFYKSRAARKSTCHWSVVCFMCFLTGDRCFVLAAA